MVTGSRIRNLPDGLDTDSDEESEALLALCRTHPNLNNKQIIALRRSQKAGHSESVLRIPQGSFSLKADGVGQSAISSCSGPSSFSEFDFLSASEPTHASSHQLNALHGQSIDHDGFFLASSFTFDTTPAELSVTDTTAKIDTSRLYSGSQPIPINNRVPRLYRSQVDESLPSLTLSSSAESHATTMSREISGASFLAGELDMFRMESNDGRDAAKEYGLESLTNVEPTFKNCNIVDPTRPRRSNGVPRVEVCGSTPTEPAGNAPLPSPKRKLSEYAGWNGENKSSGRNAELEQHRPRPYQQPKGRPDPRALRPTRPQCRRQRYVRPVHPRIYCTKCSDQSQGFRGEHEYRRHYDRAHASIKRCWVVVDRSPDGKFMLETKCKACRNGKKYGTDYNATAHLKRQHFNTEKNPKVELPEHLRDWIQAVEVRGHGEEVTRQTSSDKEEEDDMNNGNNGQEEAASTAQMQINIEDTFFNVEDFEASQHHNFKEAMARTVDALHQSHTLWCEDVVSLDPSVNLQISDVDRALQLTSNAAVADTNDMLTYTRNACASYSYGCTEAHLPANIYDLNAQLHQDGHLPLQLGSLGGGTAVNGEFVNFDG